MKASGKTRTAAEMRFMRTTAKYIWSDYKRNYDTLKELKTEPVMRKIKKYCKEFAGSISQWKFTTLTVQYTTLDYSSQLF
jgi:hypothetical protein